MLHLETQDYQQFVSRMEVEGAIARSAANATKSPRMTKKAAQNQRNQGRPNDPANTMSELPNAPITPYGVTKAVQQFFEVCKSTSAN